MTALDLTELFGDAAPIKSTILPEAAVERLREAYARFVAPCPFKPGDLVTPRKDSGTKFPGDPAIVLEVEADPQRVTNASEPVDIGSNNYGVRLDIRVANITPTRDGDVVTAHWGQSWLYEAWRPSE